uniref:Uncharacterized protein n=1 Tax=Rhizophora mucronata TaxID=61149 RepID=A0A2P2KDR7_RHIMU
MDVVLNIGRLLMQSCRFHGILVGVAAALEKARNEEANTDIQQSHAACVSSCCNRN